MNYNIKLFIFAYMQMFTTALCLHYYFSFTSQNSKDTDNNVTFINIIKIN